MKKMNLLKLLLILIIISGLAQAPRHTIGDWIATMIICFAMMIDPIIFILEKLVAKTNN